MSKENLDYYYKFALKLVKDAGSIIREAKDKTASTKTADWDLVTIYDKKLEDVLINSLQKEFPTHKFIGEESAADANFMPELTDEPTWIIDPIDGTTNFVHGFPYCCISVGLTINKEEVIGIIYNPVLEELFCAQKGKGTYYNGKRVYCSKIEEVNQSVIGFEISIARNEIWTDIFMKRLRALVTKSQALRSMGSAALGLAYVSNGSQDVYTCDGLKPWDAAAGAVLVREAGGVIYATNGDKFDVMKPSFLVASTQKLADEALALIKEADSKK